MTNDALGLRSDAFGVILFAAQCREPSTFSRLRFQPVQKTPTIHRQFRIHLGNPGWIEF